MKRCNKCGEEKPLTEFHKGGKNGRKTTCKKCVNGANKKNKKRHESVDRAQKKDLEHWKEVMNGHELYIAMYEMNLAFSYHEYVETIRLHDEGYSCVEIGKYLRRDPDEVAILKIDLAKKGVI